MKDWSLSDSVTLESVVRTNAVKDRSLSDSVALESVVRTNAVKDHSLSDSVALESVVRTHAVKDRSLKWLHQGSQTQLTRGPLEVESGSGWAALSIS